MPSGTKMELTELFKEFKFEVTDIHNVKKYLI